MARHPGSTGSRVGAAVAAILAAGLAGAQYAQVGGKLIGAGAAGAARQGYSVAISSDALTAVVGGWGDAADTGAAWVFTRAGGGWSQQGGKLVGAGAVGPGRQGRAVAVSGDGSTAIVVAPYDDGDTGAAWVYTRSAGVWSQQGGKLVGTGAAGTAAQGWSVALSADGDTAIVGGIWDGSDAGAAWVFTRSAGAWSQQGDKLVGAGAVGPAYQGYSVALSADGDTALVGGVGDSGFVGAAWVFARSAGVWSQQGPKLVGAGADGASFQGYSAALSADGGTALVGGYGDGSDRGAAWVFARSGGAWTQLGARLVGAGAVGAAAQGWSVALSGDGRTAVLGGPSDAGNAGAAWVFRRADQDWLQVGEKLVGAGMVGAASQGAVAVSADGATIVAGGSFDDALTGAAWVFAAPAPCQPPAISAQPRGVAVARGGTASLAVTATGSPPLAYQWYQGESGDTSTPVGDGGGGLTTPPLAVATSFWVRVGNACGSVDSATATVAIAGAVRRHVAGAPAPVGP